jgi:hypothetical protein
MTIKIIKDEATGQDCYQIIDDKYGELKNPLTEAQKQMTKEELEADVKAIGENWIKQKSEE